MPSEYELLRSLLLEARNEAGLTQSEVARRLGVPQSFVSKYEIGERQLDVIEFLRITKALETNPRKILDQIEGAIGD